MDTKRFELTDEEVGNLEWTETPSGNYAADFSFVDDYSKEVRVILQAQIAKIQSFYEPVELEALGDEEILEAQLFTMETVLKIEQEAGENKDLHAELCAVYSGRQVSQRTIQQNQSKGQLYRLKEGK